ncbi:MAG: CHC2 zinc finger domain-containing protein [bacterium]
MNGIEEKLKQKGIWETYKKTILNQLTYQDVYGDIKNQKESTDGWVTGQCPFHSDEHNSFGFNKNTLAWVCFSDCGKGSVFDFIMHTSCKNFKDTLLELGSRLGIPRPFQKKAHNPPIREELLKQWTACINEELKRYLRETRGLADVTIEKYEIGWDVKRQRYTIPVRDERGNLVNIRLYNPHSNPKIINYTDGKHKYGSPARLYGLDELVKSNNKQVIVTEGEWDRLILQQEDFTAVTGTHGCSVFRPEWVKHFEGKDVVIIYDCDKEGQTAVNNIVIKAFRNSKVSSIKNVILPLKGTKDAKDITDYFHKYGSSNPDLQKLIDETPVFTYQEPAGDEAPILLDSFTDIENKEYIDKRIECAITVCGETDEAFHAVEEFSVTYCSKLKKGECFDCSDIIRIPLNSSVYIGSCMSTNVQVVSMLRDLCCRYGQKPTIEILKRTTVKEFFCHQKVNRIVQMIDKKTKDESQKVIQYINGSRQELMEKKVYYLSSDEIVPGNYIASGFVKTHPKTQQITFLIEKLTPIEEDFQSFDLQKNIKHLTDFKKLSWEDILVDLTENVTQVYERDEILVAILLTYCSPLRFNFNDDSIPLRGWINAVIIGDSGTGKTQTYTRLSEFVDIGDCLSGLTGTRTGLAYALVEHKQKGWQVKIGRFPANSGKILTLDETQHLPDWHLRTISKAMEEGFIQIDRVKSKGYKSQTRLIMICNPKYDEVMDSYSFGCEALKDLFPPTVIRRIDFAVFANASDIKDPSFINKTKERISTRKITPEMLRAVIYWTWNLKPDQIIFTDEATNLCLQKADEMIKMFGYAPEIPLALLSDFRNKLARISASFAVLRLSSDDAFSQLIIGPNHVQMAVEFLTRIYTHDNCALDDYSEIQKKASELTDYNAVKKAFLERKENEKHDSQNEGIFARAIQCLYEKKDIRREDLADLVGCSTESVRKIIKLLKRYEMVNTSKDGYRKKPKFNKFLRRFSRECPDFFKNNEED